MFNDVLIWLERMQDDLDAVVTPLPPHLDETLETLEARRRLFDEKVVGGRASDVPTWASREDMGTRSGGQLSIFEHRTLTHKLSTLWSHEYGGLVHAKIAMFSRSAGKEKQEMKKSGVDKFGRSKALGRRKTSQSKAMLTPGDGVVTVNGVSLTDYFVRTIDRCVVANSKCILLVCVCQTYVLTLLVAREQVRGDPPAHAHGTRDLARREVQHSRWW